MRADAAAADVAARRAHVEDRCRAADERLAKADAAIADAIQARDDALLKAKQAQHHAEQALATQKQCDAHELALQGKLETASTAEALVGACVKIKFQAPHDPANLTHWLIST